MNSKSPDTAHIDALNLRLSNEKIRLHSAKDASEIAFRKVVVSQIEREIAAEYALLGDAISDHIGGMSDDELLKTILG